MNKVKVSEVCYVNEWRHGAFREGNEREEERGESAACVTGAIVPPASILRNLLSSQTSSARNLHGSAAERELGVLEGREMLRLDLRECGRPDWPSLNGNVVNIHVYSQVLFTRLCDIAGQNWSRETGCQIDRGNGESWWWWDFGESEVLTAPFGVVVKNKMECAGNVYCIYYLVGVSSTSTFVPVIEFSQI